MLSRRFDVPTAQVCIEIAVEDITAVELSRVSSFVTRTAHYTLVLHLTQAMVPMICIIIRHDVDETLVQPAIDAFNRSLKTIKEYAPSNSFARRTLRQLERPIHMASEIIDSRWSQYAESCELTPTPAPINATMGDGVSAALPPQIQSWDSFGQMTMPRNVGMMSIDASMPTLPDELMLWDDCFGTRDPLGAWHAGHLLL